MENTLKRWTRPDCYVGATWEGYFVAPIARSRDSDLLTQSNWDAQWKDLSKLKADVPGEDCVSPVVASENHWAVGWVEWVAIHESNEAALSAASELAAFLEDYPVLDDEDYSRREWEEYRDTWERWGAKGFAKAIRDAFNLCDAAFWKLEDIAADAFRELYESLIPSGEFFVAESDGVRIQIGYAVKNLDRATLAKFLRTNRTKKTP